MPKPTSTTLTNSTPVRWEVPTDLRMVGFIRPATEATYRLVLSLTGKEKSGKDHFSYGAPDPMVMINIDAGTEGVVNKFAHRRIAISNHVPPRDAIQMFNHGKDRAKIAAHFTKEWAKIDTAYSKALESKSVRTIIMNTATELFDALKLVRFEGVLNMKPHHYSAVNDEYRSWIRQVYNTDKNLILTHKVRKQYVVIGKKDGNDVEGWNGEYERAGYGDSAYLVQCNAETYCGPSRLAETEDGAGDVFGIHVIDCRQNADVRNLDLEGLDCSFAMLATMVFPETDVEFWQ